MTIFSRFTKLGILVLLTLLFLNTVSAKEQPFNRANYVLWERYYSRMEQVNLLYIDEEIFINAQGDFYFKTSGENYYQNPKKREEILLLAIADEDDQIRYSALVTAVNLNQNGVVDQVIKHIQTEKDKTMKRVLIWAAGNLGDEKIVLPLTQYLREAKDPEIISMLALALGRIGGNGDEVGPLLYLAENSIDLMVKCSAMMGIGRLGIKDGKDILIKALKDPRNEIRFTSLLSLSFVIDEEDKDAQEFLKTYLKKEYSQYVIISGAYTMQKLWGYNQDYFKILISGLKDYQLKYPAVDFLTNLGFRGALPHFRELILSEGESSYLSLLLRDGIRTLSSNN